MYSFRLNNIKSFVDSGSVEIKPITIFIGKNSSGKSSLVRFPIVLKQTIEESISPLLFYGKYIDYGNYEDIVFNHNEKENVSFTLTISLEDIKNTAKQNRFFFEDSIEDFLIFIGDEGYDDSKIHVSIEVGRQVTDRRFFGELEIKKYEIKFDEKELFLVTKVDYNNYKTYTKNKLEKEFKVIFDGLTPRILYQNLNKNEEKEWKENKETTNIRNLLRIVEMYVSSTVANISYIGPFRRIPDRNYRYQEANKLSISSDGSYTSELLASYYRRNDTRFFKRLNDWLADHLHINIEVEDLKGGMYRIVVEDLQTGVKNNIIDVGFGLSQVLPIIVQVLQGNQGRSGLGVINRRMDKLVKKFTIVEQPELHLHPYAQSNLADLFIMGANISPQNCFIVETHSEHLILRLRRRILEGSISSEKVAIYYVEKDLDDKNGSIVKKLNIESNGDIKDWPADFFDQDYKEIMQINKLKANMDKGDDEW
ncbi:hypothetical protein AN960_20905 [Bacillus sp. FJAT-25509]|uniref:AAA family ATPase n=1 Tax=Bacillus sp. FJAT-25509 TaxID=1712029 RepID=UPI0006F73CE0|nr:DUF3696 domain-containing protein [Bacillus sp. FJAT-25509]KQL33535.1 hypothetical protein AN960_20905 [Bacillus sp. FJAT-25509]